MNVVVRPTVESGSILMVPLDKLKKSPKNARKTPHSEAAIAALAGSIGVKSMLQPLVVEPERDAAGAETGCYLVTIGEGRRLAQRLRAKRKEIKKNEPIRCVLDTEHDPHEISLDENVTRSDMHPADQFEAFQRLAEERGYGPEEIGARFGVSATLVRQRLRLAAVSPKLLAAYREGEVTLPQLMAFAVTSDHARQEQVHATLTWNREPPAIRRMLTETHVAARDRRAILVGAEAYGEAGGVILRDLFTEDGGGWFEDPALLDRLALARLEAQARAIQEAEGWRWVEASLDFPDTSRLARVYRVTRALNAEEEAQVEALQAEHDELVARYEQEEAMPESVSERLDAIDTERRAIEAGTRTYAPDDLARAGTFVFLGHDGAVRIERGFVRPEDEPKPADVPDAGETDGGSEPEPPAEPGERALTDALVRDLSAHRTMALRATLGDQPAVACLALVHALALHTFYPGTPTTCLDLTPKSVGLSGCAPGIADSLAGRAVSDRHEAWGARLPENAADLWAVLVQMSGEARAALLAHCVAETVTAVIEPWDRSGRMVRAGNQLAAATGLDMRAYWTPTAAGYFSRVSKSRILEAVREGVGDDAAERLAGLKKTDMAETAAELLEHRPWLPELLRTPVERGADA